MFARWPIPDRGEEVWSCRQFPLPDRSANYHLQRSILRSNRATQASGFPVSWRCQNISTLRRVFGETAVDELRKPQYFVGNNDGRRGVGGGRLERLAAEAITALETHPAYLSFLAWIQAAAGRKTDARETINRLNELSQRTYVSPYWMAIAWTGLGDKDEAFKWFERVFAERASSGAIALKVTAMFDSLRSDPRYADLLRRANFTP